MVVEMSQFIRDAVLDDHGDLSFTLVSFGCRTNDGSGLLAGPDEYSWLVSCLVSCTTASYHTFSAEVCYVGTQSGEKEEI